ncbi:MAG: hypothetical protein Q7S06_01715 [Nanoarchaeota archaeon]|nr:hypothetical protein [Nanoarchaeota archaeon]
MPEELKKAPFQITEEEFHRWNSESRIGYPYGRSNDFIITLMVNDGRVHYRKSELDKGRFIYYHLSGKF